MLKVYDLLGERDGKDTLRFLQEVIKREMHSTTSSALLLRGNSRASWLLQVFSRHQGLKTVVELYAPYVAKLTADNISLDFLSDEGDTEAKKAKLIELCNVLLSSMTESIEKFPPIMRRLCAILKEEVGSQC